MIRRTLFTFAIILGVYFESVAQNNLGFKLPENINRVNIPFESYNNLVVIPVILNGILPLKFVLDTGVRTTILTEKAFSDILNLDYDKHLVISGVGGKKLVDAYITNGVSLELPGMKGEGHTMLVLEKDYIELSNYLGTQVHGVLGYEIFSRFIVKIDFKKRVLSLIKPHKFRRGRKFLTVPINIEDTKPYVNASVTQQNGQTSIMKIMIDSGASHGLLLEPNNGTEVTLPEKTITSNIGRGIGGELKGKIGRISKLAFGDFTFEDVITTFPDPDAYMDSLKMGLTFRHGTMGGAILSRFTTIFDYSTNKMYLKKNSAYKKSFEYNMSGLVIKATGSRLKKFKIVEVRNGSSAEKAGVLSGDFVLSVNNNSANNLPLQEVIGMFNSRSNKSIRIELERDGKRVFKKFKLVRQI
jgi:hypothetical protein